MLAGLRGFGPARARPVARTTMRCPVRGARDRRLRHRLRLGGNRPRAEAVAGNRSAAAEASVEPEALPETSRTTRTETSSRATLRRSPWTREAHPPRLPAWIACGWSARSTISPRRSTLPVSFASTILVTRRSRRRKPCPSRLRHPEHRRYASRPRQHDQGVHRARGGQPHRAGSDPARNDSAVAPRHRSAADRGRRDGRAAAGTPLGHRRLPR